MLVLVFSVSSLAKVCCLTHSAQEYFEKLALKKKKKNRNFKRLYLKSYGSKLAFSESSFNILLNKVFFACSTMWVHGRGFCPLQPPVTLRVAHRAQKVNDEPVSFEFALFINFFWKWAETFEKLQFFTFGPKQCFYLTHSAQEYSQNLAFKEKKPRNLKRLYLRAFIQFYSKQGCFLHALPTWVQGKGILPLQSPVLMSTVCRRRRVSDEQYKFWICSFYSVSFGNEKKL